MVVRSQGIAGNDLDGKGGVRPVGARRRGLYPPYWHGLLCRLRRRDDTADRPVGTATPAPVLNAQQ